MKLLNSVASVLMCGEFLARLVHIHAIFHRYCTVHCKIMIPREDASITRMYVLTTLPLSCNVSVDFYCDIKTDFPKLDHKINSKQIAL